MDTDKPKEEEEKKLTREQYEAQLVPKYAEAIKFAVQLLEKTAPTSATAALATPDDAGDLEGNEPAGPILLQEEFDDRPLPLLIGTQDFDDDDNCGLYIEESGTKRAGGWRAGIRVVASDSRSQGSLCLGGGRRPTTDSVYACVRVG